MNTPNESEETSSATRICFLPSWPSDEAPRGHSGPPLMCAMAFAAVCVVTVLSGLIWAVESLVVGSIAAPLRFLWAVGLASMAALPWLAVRRLQRKRRHSRAKTEDTGSSNTRFICIDTPPNERPDAALADVPFEPAIFAAFLVVNPSGKSSTLGVLAMLIFFAGEFTGLWKTGLAAVGGFAAVFAGFGLGELMWPTYFRVVPGRIDIMRYSFLSDRPVGVTKTPLRDARIIYDHSNKMLHLHTDGEWKDYWIMLVPRRRQFIRALFLAAASTHQPPPLPDDALLG